MKALDRLMGRWWTGAYYLIACGLAYVFAFVCVAAPIVILDELGIYEPTNWTYWLSAGVIAPFVAGSRTFREIVRSIEGEAAGSARPNSADSHRHRDAEPTGAAGESSPGPR